MHVAAVVVVMTLKLQERLTSTEFELHSVNHRLLQLSASSQHVAAFDDVTCRQVCDITSLLLTMSPVDRCVTAS